jgi:hypothetical protein
MLAAMEAVPRQNSMLSDASFAASSKRAYQRRRLAREAPSSATATGNNFNGFNPTLAAPRLQRARSGDPPVAIVSRSRLAFRGV